MSIPCVGTLWRSSQASCSASPFKPPQCTKCKDPINVHLYPKPLDQQCDALKRSPTMMLYYHTIFCTLYIFVDGCPFFSFFFSSYQSSSKSDLETWYRIVQFKRQFCDDWLDMTTIYTWSSHYWILPRLFLIIIFWYELFWVSEWELDWISGEIEWKWVCGLTCINPFFGAGRRMPVLGWFSLSLTFQSRRCFNKYLVRGLSVDGGRERETTTFQESKKHSPFLFSISKKIVFTSSSL